MSGQPEGTVAAHLAGLFGLEGRVAVVTGGGSGLGRQAALALAAAGASVVVAGRTEARLRETADTVAAAGGKADLVAADLGTLEGIDSVAERAPRPFGAPDILVNAAAMNMRKDIREITAEDWARTLDLNLRAPLFLGRALAPGMAGKGRGAIVNVASLQSFRVGLGDASYGASKGGILQLTRSMAKSFAPHVTVNAVAPGFFPTALTKGVFGDPELARRLAESTLLGRNGELADFEGVVVFLCAKAGGYITGTTIPLDGGFLAK